MNSAKRNLSIVIAVFIGAVLWAGCGTVKPKTVEAHAASFDGTNQNSGFIGYSADGQAMITPHARERYNALIETYWKRFTPPLKSDAGLTAYGDYFKIDSEHLSKFATMNRWKREGK